MADLVVYFRRGKVEARGLVTVPPDIAVEIVSPDPKDQKRDRIAKLAIDLDDLWREVERAENEGPG